MKAVILAAGIGRRLSPITDTTPKCLIKVGGKTIIERYFENFERLGIREAVMVVGHLKEKIIAAVGNEFHGVKVTYLNNERFEEGNIFTVHLASQAFDDDIVMMDADVIFHPGLLERQIKSPNVNCYLMDEGFVEHDGEECKVAALHGRVVANNRRIRKEYDRIGEGLGFLKLSRPTAIELKKIVAEFIERGETTKEYEDALEILLDREVVGFEPVGDLPWTEIDFADDIPKAAKIAALYE